MDVKLDFKYIRRTPRSGSDPSAMGTLITVISYSCNSRKDENLQLNACLIPFGT
jgi:hypothetical protein